MKETVKIDKRKLRGKYDTHVGPRLEEIKAWAGDGMTEEEIAKNFGVAYSTFREYKNKYYDYSMVGWTQASVCALRSVHFLAAGEDLKYSESEFLSQIA